MDNFENEIYKASFRVFESPCKPAGLADRRGLHLIEASAGTGKTYNIQNIYARLIMEETDFKVANILVMTYTEAAKRLNLSRPTVYRLAKAGRLEVVPLDGVNRIRLKSVIDFANNGGAR